MGIPERGHSTVFHGKLRQILHYLQQLAAQIAQTVTVKNHIGVVRHITAGGAEMDDSGSPGGRQAVGIHVCHDVMAHFLLPFCRCFEIYVREMLFQFSDLLFRHRQAKFMFRPGQRHPEPAPGLDPLLCGKQFQHIGRGIARRQRGFIYVLHCVPPYLST